VADRLVARVRGRQQPEPPEPPQRTPEEDAHELRMDAIKEQERRIQEDEPDKDRYQDV
jgi:hypothetical protein